MAEAIARMEATNPSPESFWAEKEKLSTTHPNGRPTCVEPGCGRYVVHLGSMRKRCRIHTFCYQKWGTYDRETAEPCWRTLLRYQSGYRWACIQFDATTAKRRRLHEAFKRAAMGLNRVLTHSPAAMDLHEINARGGLCPAELICRWLALKYYGKVHGIQYEGDRLALTITKTL